MERGEEKGILEPGGWRKSWGPDGGNGLNVDRRMVRRPRNFDVRVDGRKERFVCTVFIQLVISWDLLPFLCVGRQGYRRQGPPLERKRGEGESGKRESASGWEPPSTAGERRGYAEKGERGRGKEGGEAEKGVGLVDRRWVSSCCLLKQRNDHYRVEALVT